MRTAKQTGSSLVEVMVALFVLAIGLLGILALQSKSMQYNQSAHIYSQAIYLANDIAERLRGNAGAATSYSDAVTATPTSAPTNCETSSCAPQDIVNWDKWVWSQNVKNFLPAGDVSISSIAFPDPTGTRNFLHIQVSFDDSRSEGKEAGADSEYDGRKSYALMVEI